MDEHPERLSKHDTGMSDRQLERRVAAIERRAERVAAVITWALAYSGHERSGRRRSIEVNAGQLPVPTQRGGFAAADTADALLDDPPPSNPVRPPTRLPPSEPIPPDAPPSLPAAHEFAAMALRGDPPPSKPIRPPLEQRVETLETLAQVIGDILDSDD